MDTEKLIPKVSILLLTLDRYQLTKYCLLNALAKAGYTDFELLMLDNGSKDKRTIELTSEKCFPEVQSGSSEFRSSNIGIAAGYNELLRKAKGEYICFLPNDILLWENWLVDLVHFNTEIEKSGLTSIHCEGEKGFFTPLLNIHDKFTHIWKPIRNITSGVSLINRHVLNTIGGFDESLGIYGREREQYAERLHLFGFNNYYIPNQYSVHLGREVNDLSEYKLNKDHALQLSFGRYSESINEMKRKKSLKIEI